MRRLAILGVVLLALAAISVGTAHALPSVLFLPTDPQSATLSGTNSTVVTKLLSEAEDLEGKGVTLTMELNGVSNLGTYLMWFKEVKKGTKRCSTPGDASGNILINNAFHLVYDTLGQALGVAALFLVTEVLIDCESSSRKLKGSELGLVKPINTETFAMSGQEKISLLCAFEGEPSENVYWNDAGSISLAKLEATVGGSTIEACENVAEPLGLSQLRMGEMIEIMG